MDKCNKVDFREYIYGVTMAKPRSIRAKISRVSKIDPLVDKIKPGIVTGVKAWAGKLSTQ